MANAARDSLEKVSPSAASYLSSTAYSAQSELGAMQELDITVKRRNEKPLRSHGYAIELREVEKCCTNKLRSHHEQGSEVPAETTCHN